MSEETLARFAALLADEVDAARDEPSPVMPSSEGIFTRLVLDHLEDAGHFDGAFDLHQEGRAGRSTFRISGHVLDEDAGRLTLFATHYSGTLPSPRVTASELTRTAERAANYVAACIGGLADRLEPSNTEAGDLARRVEELGRRIDRLKVVVLTDSIAAALPSPEIGSGERRIELEVYDLFRLHRVIGEGQTRADIDIDIAELAGSRIPCLPVATGGEQYEAFLAAFPGEFLSRIYDRYGARLLELNVRAFLGLAGRKSVNAELRRTLVDRPAMFLAYNNGIVATADEIRTETEAGATFLVGLRGLQVVNGGQTTASLHRARRKDGASLAAVDVAVKLIRVAAGDLEEMVASISRAANRQNTVQQADFSVNDPFHRAVETLANNTWLESGRGRWFYERARGSYLAAEQKAAFRASEQRAFREQTPRSRRFGKLDLARYLSAWDGFPWRVALGGQKNFQAFMQRRKDMTAPDPDEAWFKRLVAVAILYKATEAAVGKRRFPAYGVNIVAYLIAGISDRTGGRIAFDEIWRRQGISAELARLVNEWAPEIDAALRANIGARNPTEWFKSEECWKDVRGRLPSFSDPLPPELSGVATKSPSDATGSERIGAADYDRIEECMRVPSADWIAAAEAGQREGILHYRLAGICMTLASYASGGWSRRPSIKQARHGLESLAKVRGAGLLDRE